MRLLLISHEYPPIGGGAATAVEALAREFVRAGHEVVVLTSAWSGLPRLSRDEGIRIRRLSALRRAADRSNILEMGSFLLAALFSIRAVVREERPDGIIGFFSVPGGVVAWCANQISGIPYVVSLRGGDVPGNEPSLRWWNAVLRPLRRQVLGDAIAVTANSQGLKIVAEAADPIRVEVIPNGVDTMRFTPTPNESIPVERPLRILFVGRLQEQKNLPLLFEQCATLPRGSFRICVVGDGPRKEDWQNHARQLGLADSIRWMDWTPRESLAEVYRSADCMVNPSLYEGMPNAVLEAMACGLPVVASRVAGNDEVILDGVTGILFDLEQPSELGAGLHRLRDPYLRRSMGGAARQRALQCFGWQTGAAQYVELFQ